MALKLKQNLTSLVQHPESTVILTINKSQNFPQN